MPDSPHIVSGSLIAHRLVDVADAIDLSLAEVLWLERHGQPGQRSHFVSVAPDKLAFQSPPLLLRLPDEAVDINGVRRPVRMSARLYDFGAVTLIGRLDVHDESWSGFVAACNALDRALGPITDSAVWQAAMRCVRHEIGPAWHRPAQRHLEEDYLVAVVYRTQPAMNAADFETQTDLAGLLSGEARQLAPTQRAELVANAYSYFEDDLVVVTRDRAVVLEPRGETDVLDILEIANAQLLEMRYYDALMDAELTSMYTMIANAHRGLSWMASRRCARLARRIHGLVAEVTRLAGNVESSLQITEDVHLARVYRKALDLFRVPALTDGVHRKLSIARDTYAALYNEASSRRSELLEIVIVLLFIFEIVLALADQ